jgi:ATP-binding cassette subfamily B protein/subfamily B ATP-binding cassette protein MsbA
MIAYVLRQWPTLLVIVVLTLMCSIVTVLRPWPLKMLVDYGLGQVAVPTLFRQGLERLSLGPTPVVLIGLAALSSLGLSAFDTALAVGLSWSWSVAGQRMVYDLASALFHRLQRLSLLFHQKRTVGDSLTRLMGDSYCLYNITDGLLVTPIQRVFSLVAMGAVAFSMDRHLAMLSLFLAPVLAGSVVYFAPRLKRRARQDRDIHSRLTSFVHQTLSSVPVVQAFGTEERNRQQFRGMAGTAIAVSQWGRVLKGAYGTVNGLVPVVGAALVLYVGGLRVLSGDLSTGGLLVFIAYLRSMQRDCRALMETLGKAKTMEANMDRVVEIMEAEDVLEVSPHARPIQLCARMELGHIRLENVTFGYEAGRPVLQNITLDVRPGETLALVGPTGAGKSTLVSLVPRFFDPWEGCVTFGGVDVREVTLSSVRSQVALVLQEPFLLPLTVAENIAYGRPGASRVEIERAAVAANADEFIRRLPQGYDSPLGERGTTLSGGERQRLAIARALLKDAPVLILDEPTSALDMNTEASLMTALDRLMRGRTVLIIAHRLSTIRRADRIVVIDKGRIVEMGTHDALLGARGLYQRFHAAQFAVGSPEAAP